MRILITGVSGWVGRRLAQELIRTQKHEVFGIGFRRDQDELRKWFGGDWEKLKYCEIDVTDSVAVDTYIDDVHPRFIYHLAAQANIRTARRNPLSTYRTNVEGSHNVLQAACNYDVQTVHLASSSDVYGVVPKGDQPITEDCPLRGNNPYAVSKIAMEGVGRSIFVDNEHLNVIVTRLFTTSGPGQNTDSAISYFAWQAARIKLGLQEPILNHGNIDNMRTFLHVDDVITAYFQLLPLNRCDTYDGNIFNLSGQDPISLSDIVATLRDLTEKEVECKQDPSTMRDKDITYQLGENTAFKVRTKWAPKLCSTHIAEHVFDYWEEKLKENPHA